jgi:acyl carrier protein
MEVDMSESSVYERIATDMQDVEQIQQKVEGKKPSVAHTQDGDPCTPPRTPMEKWLAEAWVEFLGLEQVDIHTDFFELGGDSLAALRILSKVRDRYNVNVPPTTLFAIDFTIAEIAKVIEQHQIEEADLDDVAEALAELEALSDEEAGALLADEG